MDDRPPTPARTISSLRTGIPCNAVCLRPAALGETKRVIDHSRKLQALCSDRKGRIGRNLIQLGFGLRARTGCRTGALGLLVAHNIDSRYQASRLAELDESPNAGRLGASYQKPRRLQRYCSRLFHLLDA